MTTIRPLSRDDFSPWLPLWESYLRFYRAEPTPAWSEATFAGLTGLDPTQIGLLAVDPQDRAVGLAHIIIHGSTWSTRPRAYLNDLFVDPGARGGDVGRQLIEAPYAVVSEQNADEVYWHTQEFNTAARSLYDTVASLTSFRVYEHEL